jgi:hypothetical protein
VGRDLAAGVGGGVGVSGGLAECALGAEIARDRSRCAVAKCWRESGARLAVKVAWHGLTAAAADVIDALYVADDPVSVALDPKSQSATLCGQLAERGIIVRRLDAEDVAVAHGEFLDLVAMGGLRHFDQKPLTDAVRGAAERPLSGAMALERKVASDQSPLTAAEFAVWAFARWEELSRPGAWIV